MNAISLVQTARDKYRATLQEALIAIQAELKALGESVQPPIKPPAATATTAPQAKQSTSGRTQYVRKTFAEATVSDAANQVRPLLTDDWQSSRNLADALGIDSQLCKAALFMLRDRNAAEYKANRAWALFRKA